MSLIVGILLPKQVALFSDNFRGIISGKTIYPDYWYQKGSEINKFSYLVSGGVDFSGVRDFLQAHFEKRGPINTGELEEMSGPLGEIAKPFLEENKKNLLGIGLPLSANNLNLLLGGWASSSKPFLAHLFCGMEASGEKVGRFDVDIVIDQPGVNFVISPWLGDDTHSEIRRKIHAYLNKYMDGSFHDQRMGGYSLFEEILKIGMEENPMIGPRGEAVFVDCDGISRGFPLGGGLRIMIKNWLKNRRRGRKGLKV